MIDLQRVAEWTDLNPVHRDGWVDMKIGYRREGTPNDYLLIRWLMTPIKTEYLGGYVRIVSDGSKWFTDEKDCREYIDLGGRWVSPEGETIVRAWMLRALTEAVGLDRDMAEHIVTHPDQDHSLDNDFIGKSKFRYERLPYRIRVQVMRPI